MRFAYVSNCREAPRCDHRFEKSTTRDQPVFLSQVNSNDLRLTPFNLDQAREALHAETNLRMVILNVGGESIAVPENLRQLKALRELATGVPFTVISDREDAQEVAAALGSETNGFIHSGIDAELAREALSFILHGGSYLSSMGPDLSDRVRMVCEIWSTRPPYGGTVALRDSPRRREVARIQGDATLGLRCLGLWRARWRLRIAEVG